VGGTWESVWLAYVVTLSGESCSDGGTAPGTVTCGFRVNSDGTIDQQEGGLYTQVDSGTDWVIPNDADATFHVRFTQTGYNETGSGDATATGTLNTWLALSSNRELTLDGTTAMFQDLDAEWTVTIEISDDGGSTVLDSGTYIMTLTMA
jgi:hypothetical protein